MKLWDSYNDVRADLALYFGQDLIQCGKLTDDRIRKLFASKPFENWKKNRENEGKLAAAELSRLDALIKGISNVAEILCKR